MSRSTTHRILHMITQLDVGGAEVQLLNLCRMLPSERFSCTVLSLKAGGSLVPRFEAAGCRVIELDRRDHGGPIGQLVKLTNFLREWEPDLIQTWLLKANHVGRLAAAISARHPVLAGFRDMGFGAGLGDTILDRLLAPASTMVLHNSDGGRRAHLARLDEDGFTRHKLLPNGIDAELFRPDPEARAQVRAERGLPDKARVVAMVARLHAIKNPALFLEVARAVRERHPDIHFWLVGGGPLATQLDVALAARPDPGIWLTGERDDVPQLLAAADLALLTSRSEGLSNTVLEAMACGLPVLATDVGGNGELVADGVNGYLLREQAAGPIAERVVQVLQNQKLAEEMGRQGRARLLEQFSLAGLAGRAGDYYERVIRGG
jgi:glycosyltransferase involved in cell wall biosynthesis